MKYKLFCVTSENICLKQDEDKEQYLNSNFYEGQKVGQPRKKETHDPHGKYMLKVGKITLGRCFNVIFSDFQWQFAGWHRKNEDYVFAKPANF